MNYTDLAKKISAEMIEYPVTTESLNEVYDIVFQKHGKDYIQDKNKILAKVTHYITVSGYDIVCIKPLKFERFMN